MRGRRKLLREMLFLLIVVLAMVPIGGGTNLAGQRLPFIGYQSLRCVAASVVRISKFTCPNTTYR